MNRIIKQKAGLQGVPNAREENSEQFKGLSLAGIL